MKESQKNEYHTLGSFTTFHAWNHHVNLTLEQADKLKEKALDIAIKENVKIKYVTGKGMRRTSTTPSLPAWVWDLAVARMKQ